ncbi:MAG: flavin reductase family protein [Alicyclobacillus sp.]|nr:flavin reductase family protein [Alicyclobacillus sp.]
MPVQPETFRHALGRFASGVTVVTAVHNGEKTGLTVSAFCSLSLNPPYILVCIDKRSSSIPLIRASQVFNVNILSSEQVHLSNHFAARSEDKFSNLEHDTGKLGAPLLRDTLARLECALAREVDGGDHVIFIGQVESAEVDDAREPLLYYSGGYQVAQPIS